MEEKRKTRKGKTGWLIIGKGVTCHKNPNPMPAGITSGQTFRCLKSACGNDTYTSWLVVLGHSKTTRGLSLDQMAAPLTLLKSPGRRKGWTWNRTHSDFRSVLWRPCSPFILICSCRVLKEMRYCLPNLWWESLDTITSSAPPRVLALVWVIKVRHRLGSLSSAHSCAAELVLGH